MNGHPHLRSQSVTVYRLALGDAVPERQGRLHCALRPLAEGLWQAENADRQGGRRRHCDAAESLYPFCVVDSDQVLSTASTATGFCSHPDGSSALVAGRAKPCSWAAVPGPPSPRL